MRFLFIFSERKALFPPDKHPLHHCWCWLQFPLVLASVLENWNRRYHHTLDGARNGPNDHDFRTVLLILSLGLLSLWSCGVADLQYNALSFIFLQVRELSWLQWHPFSVSSSPLDGNNHLSILIKVLGEWTAKLGENISEISEACSQNECCQPPRLTASVEGPYGHELPYHLTYVRNIFRQSDFLP